MTATSGPDGRFELKAPAGQATARFTKDGYADGVRAVSLVDGRPTQLDVTIRVTADALDMLAQLQIAECRIVCGQDTAQGSQGRDQCFRVPSRA